MAASRPMVPALAMWVCTSQGLVCARSCRTHARDLMSRAGWTSRRRGRRRTVTAGSDSSPSRGPVRPTARIVGNSFASSRVRSRACLAGPPTLSRVTSRTSGSSGTTGEESRRSSGVAAPIPSLTYLTFDAVTRGVGASQVLPYVSRLEARGVSVELREFEPRVPGAAGGAGRMLRGALAVRGAELVHARAHLAGAAVVLGRPRRWLWDVRSLWIDERIEAGMLRRRGLEERVLRRLERKAAGSCDAVVMLSAAAVPVLSERTGVDVGSRSHVIPTCVDLSRFGMSPLPPADPVRLLLSGSL